MSVFPTRVPGDGEAIGPGGVITPGVSILGGGVRGGGRSSGRGGGIFPGPCEEDACNTGRSGANVLLSTSVHDDVADGGKGVEGGEEASIMALYLGSPNGVPLSGGSNGLS